MTPDASNEVKFYTLSSPSSKGTMSGWQRAISHSMVCPVQSLPVPNKALPHAKLAGRHSAKVK